MESRHGWSDGGGLWIGAGPLENTLRSTANYGLTYTGVALAAEHVWLLWYPLGLVWRRVNVDVDLVSGTD